MELRVEFSPSSVSGDKGKPKLKEILNAVCAILNSSKRGGKLILFSGSKDLLYSQKNADDITRKIEQKLQDTFGVEKTIDFFDKIQQRGDNAFEMHYEIMLKTMSPVSLFTINYHLYRTSDTQVQQIPSKEPLEQVAKVINGRQTRKKKYVLGDHMRTFVYSETIPLEESKEIQFKCLDDKVDDVTKECSLATRMTSDSNKLIYYVSAFANGSGGHIYYGIKTNEDGFYVVYGQTVSLMHDKEIIINKVKSAIDKLLVWPGTKGCLKKGVHWDIFFEKVSGIEELKYVIVISVNSHETGVFVREPESYVVDRDGKVKPMDLREWIERFRLVDYRDIFSHEDLPQVVGRCSWSSPKAFQNHLKVLGKLIILRNNGREDEFKAYKKVLTSCDGNTKCLCQQQEAGDFFRKNLLLDAELKLKVNEKLLNAIPARCADVEIYQTRRLCWMGVVKRAQGDYGESRKLFDEALQKSHNQPPILILPWVHCSRAKILEIDIVKEVDPTKERDLRMKCLDYYESALRSSFALSAFPEKLVTDLRQRAYIGMARVSFGVFYDGKKVVHKTCSPSDKEYADDLLGIVDASVNKLGLSMTSFSETEFQLVRAEQYYHDWEESHAPNILKKACEESKKALKNAKQRKFYDVIDFAEGQIKEFEASVDVKKTK